MLSLWLTKGDLLVSLLDERGVIVGKQIDLLQGTLDMLILKAVSLGPLHGYGVLLRIQQISGDQLEIRDSSEALAILQGTLLAHSHRPES